MALLVSPGSDEEESYAVRFKGGLGRYTQRFCAFAFCIRGVHQAQGFREIECRRRPELSLATPHNMMAPSSSMIRHQRPLSSACRNGRTAPRSTVVRHGLNGPGPGLPPPFVPPLVTAELIDGRMVAKQINDEVREEVKKIK